MSAVINRDKLKIRQAFANAAEHYDDFAHLQRMVADSLLQKSALTTLQGKVLDIGCGTGYLTQQLQVLGGYQQLIAFDIAQPMLQKTQQRLQGVVSYVCGDADMLPFQAASLDSIFSSLALQWCQHLPTVLQNFRRVLKPGGTLVFATFGTETLTELKQAWATVDQYRHINDFHTPQQLHALLPQDEWQNVQISRQVFRSQYASVAVLLRELKGLGAQSVSTGRKPQLTTKAQMQQMFEAYPKINAAGRIAASFEIIWVVAEAKL
ncbi:MAG: malonyl-ACP O-methyltransferase BioC [Methylococcaceae bacterium]|nr:malonyl-ACP O-methyltransferase BioC [Methylococcaceae bacterium]